MIKLQREGKIEWLGINFVSSSSIRLGYVIFIVHSRLIVSQDDL